MPVRSLKGQLLTWLLVPLLCLIALNAWIKYNNAHHSAELVTDRLLLASARAIAEQIRVRDDGIEVLIPPVALEIFETTDRDHVFYSLTGPDGTLHAGEPSLVPLVEKPDNLQPAYFDTQFNNENIRVVALRQPVALTPPAAAALVIVGVTLHAQERVAQEIWRRNFLEQLLLVITAGGLTWFGVNRGLRPLQKLREALTERDPQLLQPFTVSGLQRELKPLVAALNEALFRIRKQIEIRRRFISDASHQLRTPLTLLKTQATVGLREHNLHSAQEALSAMLVSIDGLTRVTNQLLVLARANPEHEYIEHVRVDLAELAHQIVKQYSGLAADRKIQLLAYIDGQGPEVKGEPTLLRELIANLVDNAVKYTPEGGTVAVTLKDEGSRVLRVEDTGPGIPLQEQGNVFKRFYRVLGTGVEGSGLGLSIVREVAQRHTAQVSMFNRADRSGLCVEIHFRPA
jgi:two-component system, OmpR family, sensor histidine kinase TctE